MSVINKAVLIFPFLPIVIFVCLNRAMMIGAMLRLKTLKQDRLLFPYQTLLRGLPRLLTRRRPPFRHSRLPSTF